MIQYKFLTEPNHIECINMTLLGWFKETMIYDISGCDWNIETYKWEGAIRCCAKIGYAPEGKGALFVPANRPLLRLYSERRHCTKNAVIEVHKSGLKRFDKMVASGLIRVPQHIKEFLKSQKLRMDIQRYAQ